MQALDLCLACKGCKAECPSGVDMAKLKYEFEDHYYKSHRRPLRDYVFGYFHIVASLLSPVAPLANAMMEMPVFKNIVAKILGVTAQRPFPKFTRQRAKILATEPLADPGGRHQGRHREKIFFLSDVFSRYVEPHVEQAALDVLSKCGYDVHVLPVIGAGASLLSKGFINGAQQHARQLLDVLDQIDPAREAAIVGLEPPEIYTLKHDYLDLLPERGAEIVQRVEKVWLLDEFLLRSEVFNAVRVARMTQSPKLGNKQSHKNTFPSTLSPACRRTCIGWLSKRDACYSRTVACMWVRRQSD